MHTMEVAHHLPYLRRFARAMTGSRASGDASVAAALQALIAGRLSLDQDLPRRVALFRAYWTGYVAGAYGRSRPSGAGEGYDRQLQDLDPTGRAVYLLSVLEQFSEAEVAVVTGLDRRAVASTLAEVQEHLSRAMDGLAFTASGRRNTGLSGTPS